MKTAMQEAIDYLREFNLEASAIILEDKFLEKEKEQIIDAFEQGIEFAFPTNGSYYYNQTFNQNK